MAKQAKRQVGREEYCPEMGFPGWPIYEVFCPECRQWTDKYGNVDSKDDHGDWHCLCLTCGNKAMPVDGSQV